MPRVSMYAVRFSRKRKRKLLYHKSNHKFPRSQNWWTVWRSSKVLDSYSGHRLSWTRFPHALQENTWAVLRFRPRQLPFKSFPMNHSSAILPFDASIPASDSAIKNPQTQNSLISANNQRVSLLSAFQLPEIYRNEPQSVMKQAHKWSAVAG